MPGDWVEALDGAGVVAQVAADAATELLAPPCAADGGVPDEWWDRYPGW